MKEEPSFTLLARRPGRTRPALAALSLSFLSLAHSAHAQSPPVLSAQISNGAVSLRIAGSVGSACTIQCATNLSGTNVWQFLTNLPPLPGSPYLILDPNTAAHLRFYRAFSQPVPTNMVTTNMVWIPPGTFVMGSPPNEALRNADETQHTVTLTKGFFMGKYQVRQGEYQAVMGFNPSKFQPANGNYSLDTNRPVEQVTWYSATNYCWVLTLQEQLAGRLPTNWVYRLPTESEWEYACRAGTTTAFHYGNALRGGMVNFCDYYEYDASTGDTYISHPIVPYLNRTTTVGSYQPNASGLYDMHGSAWEWCQDWYDAYPARSVTDPQGPVSGSSRVKRGGSWQAYGDSCRSAIRQADDPTFSHATLGFRVVLAQTPP